MNKYIIIKKGEYFQFNNDEHDEDKMIEEKIHNNIETQTDNIKET